MNFSIFYFKIFIINIFLSALSCYSFFRTFSIRREVLGEGSMLYLYVSLVLLVGGWMSSV